jgi:sodium/hydrogen antiporter
MTDPVSVSLLVIGGFVLVVGLFASLIKNRLFITSPLLAFLVGILIGPRFLALADPTDWGDPRAVFHIATELTLAIALMEVALRVPPRFLQRYWRGLAVLLLVLMPAMWLVSGAVVHWTLGVSWTLALLVGAILVPTDPIVATSILSGRGAEERLPDRLRFLLTAEAGANDGFAYPFFALPLLALTSAGPLLGPWLVDVVFYKVGGAVVIGITIGLAAGYALHFAEDRRYIDRASFLAFTLALTLFVLGLSRLLGTEPLVAVFLSGIAFDFLIDSKERHAEERVQEMVNQFFTLPVFILLGAAIPWEDWIALGPTVLLTVFGVLCLRRLPVVLLLRGFLQGVEDRKDAWFVGWFGPIGIAALYLANEAFRQTGNEFPWVVGTLVIAASTVVHGISATPLIRSYGPPTFDTEPGEGDLPSDSILPAAQNRAQAAAPPTSDTISMITKIAIKMKNRILAIPAAAVATPPKPKNPAIRATTRKIMAQVSKVLSPF